MDAQASSSPLFALFPGQGSQYVGMGKSLFENFQIARDVFEEASDATKTNLKKICFDGPESDLTLTENTQPCLLAVSVAAFRVAHAETGFAPVAVAGHSLGEYSALVAAGSLSLFQAALWVKKRGQFMQKAVPEGQGTMAAVLGFEDSKIESLCKEASGIARSKRNNHAPPTHLDHVLTVDPIVEPANFNSPGQIVIAGSIDAVAEAITLVKAAGSKAIPLSVSAPFHCSLMKPARMEMETLFGATTTQNEPKALEFPYIPNRTGRLNREPGTVMSLLIDQVDHAVLWRTSIESAIDSFGSSSGSALQWVEFGPGKVLQGLCKRIVQNKIQDASRYTYAGVSDLDSLKSFSQRK
jgi:[acyl-carrier-protein] S-malonyltransferase